MLQIAVFFIATNGHIKYIVFWTFWIVVTFSYVDVSAAFNNVLDKN